MAGKKRLRHVLILLVVALVCRLIYLQQVKENPFFNYPIIDAQTYDEMAVKIAAGQEPLPVPFYQPPLYPYFLGLLYALFGRDLLLVRLVQMAMGIASVLLLYLLAGRLFSRRVALVAALAYALYGTMIFYEGELLAPVLIVFLNLLLALSVVAALDKPTWFRALGAGLLLGLSALTMSVVLPMGLFIPAYAWYHWRRDPMRPKWKPGFLLAAIFVLGTLLAIAPVTLRNWRIGHEFVPISTNAGINFYLSSGSDYEEKIAIRPGYEWEELYHEPSRQGIYKSGAQSAYFMNKALRAIAADPAGYALLLLKKAYLLANGHEIMRDQDIYSFRQYSALLSVLIWKKWLAFPYGILLPLALLGMALALRQRVPHSGLLAGFILVHAIVFLAFFITARYRLNVLPFLAAFAAYGAVFLWDALRQRQWRHAAVPLACLFGLLVFCNWRVGAMSREFSIDSYYNLATKLLKEGDTARAKAWLLKAVELDPLNAEVNGNLGVLYDQERQPQEAKKCYLRILEKYPDDIKAHLNLADLCARLGELDKSRQHYEHVLRVEADNEEALRGMRLVQGLERQREAAERSPMVRSALEKLAARPGDPGLLNDLGAAFIVAGYPDMAIEPLRMAIAANLKSPHAHNNLGILLMQAGDLAGAKREFLAALALDATYPNARHNLDVLHQLEQENHEKAR